MNICIYGASSDKIKKIYIEKVEQLGRKMAERGHTLVFGAGKSGVMGACARGMYEGHGYIVGVSPNFFKVDGVLFEHCDEMIYTDTMRQRKQILEERSDAYIVAPGGIGTYDEFFEMLTLKQLARHSKAIVLYNINGYYDEMIKMMQKTADEEFMTQAGMNLFRVFDDADKMLDWIEKYKGEAVKIRDMKNIVEDDE